jgi:hypothetical protein
VRTEVHGKLVGSGADLILRTLKATCQAGL